MAQVKDNSTPAGAVPPAASPNTGGSQQYRIHSQIEQDADYYEPSIYSALTNFWSFRAESDPLTQDFLPITPAAYKLGDSKRNGLMFVVGLLPPTSNISGRLIDRSGTVGALKGTGSELSPEQPSSLGTGGPSSGKYGSIVTAPGYAITVSSNSVNIGATPNSATPCPGGSIGIDQSVKPRVVNAACTAVNSVRQVYQAMYDAYKRRFGTEPNPTAIQFLTAHSLRETSGNWTGNNPAMLAGNSSTGWGFKFGNLNDAHGDTVRWWQNFPSAEAGADAYLAFISKNPNVLTAASQGDVLGFLTSMAQQSYFEEPIDLYYNNYGTQPGWPALLTRVANAVPEAGLGDGNNLPKRVPQSCAFKEYSQDYYKRTHNQTKSLPQGNPARVARFNVDSPYGADCALDAGGAGYGNGSTPTWANDGSGNANKDAQQSDKTSGLNVDRERFGKALLDEQANYIRAAQDALETMKRMPPLRMLVNPSSFTVSCEKVISDGNRSRRGNIIEHWGDGQDKIEGSGKIAGFFSADVNDARGPGLARTTRNWSASFQNFLSLWLLYRNNGGIWLPESFLGDRQWDSTSLATVGSIYVYYDGILYFGSFDSLDFTESDDAPFSLEYSFSFTVRAWFLLDRNDEGDFDYGDADVLGQYSATTPPGTSDTSKSTDYADAAGAQRQQQAASEAQSLAAASSDPAAQIGLGGYSISPLTGGPGTIPTTSPDRR